MGNNDLIAEKFNDDNYIHEYIDLLGVDIPTTERIEALPETEDKEYQQFKISASFFIDELTCNRDDSLFKRYKEDIKLIEENLAFLEPILKSFIQNKDIPYYEQSLESPIGYIDMNFTYTIGGDRNDTRILLSEIVDDDFFIEKISKRVKLLKKKLDYTKRFVEEYKLAQKETGREFLIF